MGISLTGDPAVGTGTTPDASVAVGDITLTGSPAVVIATTPSVSLALGPITRIGTVAIATATPKSGTLALGALTLVTRPAIGTGVTSLGGITGGASTNGEPPKAPKRIKIPGYYRGAMDGVQPVLAKEFEKLQRAQSNSDTVLINANYALEVIDRMLLVDTSRGDVTITLKPAKTRFELPVTIAKISSDSNNVIIHAQPDEHINDSGGLEFSDPFVAYSMHPDGASHWWLEGVNERIVKLTPGTYTKVVVNENGRVGAGSTTIDEFDIELHDITTNDANAFRHGFLPKLPNDDTLFLNGKGQWVPLP